MKYEDIVRKSVNEYFDKAESERELIRKTSEAGKEDKTAVTLEAVKKKPPLRRFAGYTGVAAMAAVIVGMSLFLPALLRGIGSGAPIDKTGTAPGTLYPPGTTASQTGIDESTSDSQFNTPADTLPDGFADIYGKAEYVYCLFNGYAHLKTENEAVTLGGELPYFRVNDESIPDMAALKALVKSYFDTGLAEKLLDTEVNGQKLYAESNGELYVISGYSALWSITEDNSERGRIFDIISFKNGVTSLYATGTSREGGQSYTASAECGYVLGEDGNIRFTSFKPVIEALYEKYNTGVPDGRIGILEALDSPGPYTVYLPATENGFFDVYTGKNGVFIVSLPISMFEGYIASDFQKDSVCSVNWLGGDIYCGSIGDTVWAVMFFGPAMGSGDKSFCISEDNGESWYTVKTESFPSGIVSGANFASEKVGFISLYSYESDSKPYILATYDGGRSWARLDIDGVPGVPDDIYYYPQTPAFYGSNGIYPVKYSLGDGSSAMHLAHLVSSDGGVSWSWAEGGAIHTSSGETGGDSAETDAAVRENVTLTSGSQSIEPFGLMRWSEYYDDSTGMWICADGLRFSPSDLFAGNNDPNGPGLIAVENAAFLTLGSDIALRLPDKADSDGTLCVMKEGTDTLQTLEFSDLLRLEPGRYSCSFNVIFTGRYIDGQYEKECVTYSFFLDVPYPQAAEQ